MKVAAILKYTADAFGIPVGFSFPEFVLQYIESLRLYCVHTEAIQIISIFSIYYDNWQTLGKYVDSVYYDNGTNPLRYLIFYVTQKIEACAEDFYKKYTLHYRKQ